MNKRWNKETCPKRPSPMVFARHDDCDDEAGLHTRCCSFCRLSSTTRPRHSSSDGTTLAACAYKW